MVLPGGISASMNISGPSNPAHAAYPHSSLEAGMMRTHNPKYAGYSGDGTGRDSYIILNNGGLTKEAK